MCKVKGKSDEETRAFCKNRIKEIVENTARAYGAIDSVEFDEVVDVLNETAISILGSDKVSFKEFPSMGADDYSYFLNKVKGAYYFLGCGNKAKG